MNALYICSLKFLEISCFREHRFWHLFFNRFLDAFRRHLAPFWLPFDALRLPLAHFSFGILLAPLWFLMGPFWQPSAHFLFPMGASSHNLAPPGTLWVRSGVLLMHFRAPLAQLGFKWQPKCRQGRSSGFKKSSPRPARFVGAFCHFFTYVFRVPESTRASILLGPMLVQTSGCFVYVKDVYSKITPYSRNRLWRSPISSCLCF